MSPLPSFITSSSLAYTIFTSGSTKGVPKGVQISHGAASSAVGSMLKAERRHEGRWRTVQFANYAFDASVLDIFNTLSSGGCLCMTTSESLLTNLTQAMNVMEVKQAILTPTVSRFVNPEEVPQLEVMILGGEQMSRADLQKWSSIRLLNVYGPTETSMVISTKTMEQTSDPRCVGKPFDTVGIVIVHPYSRKLVPFGSIGEICVSGPQLSSGYLNRPDLNKSSFQTSPFDCSSQLYCTGDLGQWLSSNELLLLGRKDTQVKISGHRIELTEIEDVIRTSGIVVDCVADAVEFGDRSQLCVFCVFVEGFDSTLYPPKGEEIHLIQRLRCSVDILAPYMRPKYIFATGQLPRLPAQKIDRHKLRNMSAEFDELRLRDCVFETVGAETITEEAYASSTQESVMRDTWSDIFDIGSDTIKQNTNFFSLGGDSITAINVVAACRARGWSITANDVLSCPALGTIAAKLKKSDGVQLASMEFQKPRSLNHVLNSYCVSPNDIEYFFPSAPGQEEFLDQGFRDGQLWVLMTVRKFPKALHLRHWLDKVRLLTAHNEILRSTFVKIGDKWIGGVLSTNEPWVDYFNIEKDERSEVLELLWNQRFTFGKPFVRYAILRYPDENSEVVIKMDHSLWDGTLLRIFDAQIRSSRNALQSPDKQLTRDLYMFHYNADKEKCLQYWESKRIYKQRRLFQDCFYPRVTDKAIIPIQTEVQNIATKCGGTIATVFQSAVELWLSQAVSSRASLTGNLLEAAYDYLLTGRNIGLADPQNVNTNCANFLPLFSTFDRHQSVGNCLSETQRAFWEAADHASVSVRDILGSRRLKDGNKVMFLYQPFEPAQEDDVNSVEDFGYVSLARSEVTMQQPYALIVEAAKSVKGHILKIMWDENVLTRAAAEEIGEQISDVIHGFDVANAGEKIAYICRGVTPVESAFA